MRNSIPTDQRCRECDGDGKTWSPLTGHFRCGECGGTGRRSETPQPTAAGGTANARRSDIGFPISEVRSTSDEEARALTGGGAKLRCAVAATLNELRRREDAAVKNGDIYQALVWTETADGVEWLLEDLESEEEEPPAVSAERSGGTSAPARCPVQ